MAVLFGWRICAGPDGCNFDCTVYLEDWKVVIEGRDGGIKRHLNASEKASAVAAMSA